MKLFLQCVSILIITVVIGIQLQQDPGYLFISMHHWAIETNVLIFMLLLFVSCIVIICSMLFISYLKHGSSYLSIRKKHDYSNILIRACGYLERNSIQQAETLLRHTLKKQQNADLLTCYSKTGIAYHQVTFIENLIKHKGETSELLLCLGELYTQQQLLARAKNYTEKSIALKPSARGFYVLAKITEQMNLTEQSSLAYKKSAELSCAHAISNRI